MAAGADMVRFDGGIRLNARRELPMDPRHKPRRYFPGQKYTWEHGFFTVPETVTEERVQLVAYKYMQKWGDYLETPQPKGPGFHVISMTNPVLDTSVVAMAITDPDRKRYALWAKVSRAPVVMHAEVPDEDVPIYLVSGYRLAD